jgi:hypothetical protein
VHVPHPVRHCPFSPVRRAGPRLHELRAGGASARSEHGGAAHGAGVLHRCRRLRRIIAHRAAARASLWRALRTRPALVRTTLIPSLRAAPLFPSRLERPVRHLDRAKSCRRCALTRATVGAAALSPPLSCGPGLSDSTAYCCLTAMLPLHYFCITATSADPADAAASAS